MEAQDNQKVSRQYVGTVLRKCLRMSYRKIKLVPYQGNSDRCLILRQQYGKFMLEKMSDKPRIINIDETWLNQTDYRRMKWREKNSTNSIPLRGITPRISMIAAIDTEGRVYFTLTQVNTDSNVFTLFLKRLFDKLSQEDRSWKSKSIILYDGAKYHVSD